MNVTAPMSLGWERSAPDYRARSPSFRPALFGNLLRTVNGDEGGYASTRRVGGQMLTRLPMALALTAQRLPNSQTKRREAYRPTPVAGQAFPLNGNFTISILPRSK